MADKNPNKPAYEEAPYPSERYAWYVVSVLMLIYVFSFIDRQILSLLIEPIKKDLGVSDTQMGLLGGFTFAVFYTFFGIPLGRVADRRSRRGLIAVGLIFWSIMTAGCGLAQRFWHLLFFRMGVGVGEATLSPAAYSLITDYFPPRRLALAISVYSMGIYIGSGLALIFGGLIIKYSMTAEGMALPLLGELRGWQMVFLAVGLPGIPIAALLATVREPLRRGVKKPVETPELIAYLRANAAAFTLHSLGFSLIALVGYAFMYWVPTFFVRTHGWTPMQAAQGYGFSILVFGSLGIIAGGLIADRLRHRGMIDGNIRTCIGVALFAVPFGVAAPMMPTGGSALALLSVVNFVLAMASGTAPAVIQQMMPGAMRGQASAIYLFIVNLVAMGIGPVSVGFLNDNVFGVENIHLSLAAVAVGGAVPAAIALVLCLGPFKKSMQYLDTWQAHHMAN